MSEIKALNRMYDTVSIFFGLMLLIGASLL